MESTSIYWMPVWRILEPYFSLKLVNPYFIKQLPGKKSDVKDAEWIATCLLKDLIRGSYVPEDRIQRCNIRISNYVSTTEGKSYQKVVEKIAEGTTDPKVLAGLIHGRIMNRVGKDVITASLTRAITQTDIDVIRQIRDEVTLAQKHRKECLDKMEELCIKWFPKQMKNLQTVPGVSIRQLITAIMTLDKRWVRAESEFKSACDIPDVDPDIIHRHANRIRLIVVELVGKIDYLSRLLGESHEKK